MKQTFGFSYYVDILMNVSIIVTITSTDEKKQYDPVGFRDSILEGLEVSY